MNYTFRFFLFETNIVQEFVMLHNIGIAYVAFYFIRFLGLLSSNSAHFTPIDAAFFLFGKQDFEFRSPFRESGDDS